MFLYKYVMLVHLFTAVISIVYVKISVLMFLPNIATRKSEFLVILGLVFVFLTEIARKITFYIHFTAIFLFVCLITAWMLNQPVLSDKLREFLVLKCQKKKNQNQSEKRLEVCWKAQRHKKEH